MSEREHEHGFAVDGTETDGGEGGSGVRELSEEVRCAVVDGEGGGGDDVGENGRDGVSHSQRFRSAEAFFPEESVVEGRGQLTRDDRGMVSEGCTEGIDEGG